MSAHSALKEIFFGFDHYDLSVDARASLKTAADWLKKNSTPGGSRSKATAMSGAPTSTTWHWALNTRRHLETLGVAAGRLSTTSCGEEILVCREHSGELLV